METDLCSPQVRGLSQKVVWDGSNGEKQCFYPTSLCLGQAFSLFLRFGGN